MNKFKIIIVFIALQASPVLAKELSAKVAKETILQKALAENAIFKCSAKQTYSSQSTGKKLDREISAACIKEVKNLSRWYDKKEQEKLSLKLLANGKRSALANRRFL